MTQWLRILLPMQGTPVLFLVQEDPTCLRVTTELLGVHHTELLSVHHNY